MTTPSDREMLEAAARAAGYEFSVINNRPAIRVRLNGIPGWDPWNPRESDSDALRLAVRLELLVNVSSTHTEVTWYDEDRSETHTIEQWDNGMTPEEWTRLAIVRAAAEIGRNMT